MPDVLTLDDYLNAAAMRISKLYSLPKVTDREVGRRLGVSHAAVSAYRQGKTFPDDETMCRLAELADMNVEAALAWLGCWRTKGAANAVYLNLARRLGRSAAAFFCVGLLAANGVGAAGGPAGAAARLASPDQQLASVSGQIAVSNSIHYAINRMRN